MPVVQAEADMSLTISKFAPTKLLSPAQIAYVRNHGTKSQTLRLTVCRVCGKPILPGEMRLSAGVGYLGGTRAHIHAERCDEN
jgi:hypothetical protein